MSASNERATVDLANALPPAAGNKALTSASLAQVKPFNEAVRYAFYLILDARKNKSRERMTASEKKRGIRWLTEFIPKRLNEALSKKRSWIKADFVYKKGKLFRRPGKVRTVKREVVSEDRIFDTIARVHNSLGHIGQYATGIYISREYYRIATQEVYFLVKLYKICHRKAHSKSKGPLRSIITTRLFERVQIDLIDITATPDSEYVWICHMEDYFSKFHWLFAMTNKEAPIVAYHIYT